jgi:flavin-binding protein dodecin
LRIGPPWRGIVEADGPSRRPGEPTARSNPVAENVYKVVEVVGSSTESIADGARNAVAKAAETLRNIEWFEVQSIRGHVVNGEVEHFQVTTKIGFRLE